MWTVAGTGPEAGSRVGRRWRPLAVAAAMTYAALALILASASVLAHATRAPMVLAVTLLAAGTLLVGGILSIQLTRYASVSALALLVGVVWLGSSLVGWFGGPTWLRESALVLSALLPALVLHLVLQAPKGTHSRRVRRTVAATAYGLTAAVTTVTILTRDPLRDPYCWHDCNLRRLALLPDREIAAAAVTTGRVLVVVLAVVAVGFALVGTRWGTERDWTALVIACPAALLAVGLAVGATGRLVDPPERASGPWFQSAHLVQVVAILLLGLGLVASAVRQRRRRAALQHLSEQVEAVPPVGALEGHLARALGDPSLRVAHWLPQSRCFVDSAGTRVKPDGAGDGTRAELRRGDELLAVVTMDRRVADGEDLGEQLGAATRLALDTERHHAEVLAQLGELRRSRERIVEAADSSRRSLERDLHDGIQAELVALLIEAGRALEQARQSGDPESVGVLTETVDRVSTAVARLRDITHGVFPAELAEDGLEAALWTLTDEAPVPVAIQVDLPDRPPAPVEQAAYHVAVEALGLVRGPGPLRLHVEQDGGTLVMRVRPIGTPAPVSLTDRVGALDGSVSCTGDEWEVVLPCGS